MMESSWKVPPEEPSLDRDEVHVWRAHLDVENRIFEQLGSLLAPEELSRRARLRRRVDARRSLVARGVLRSILARYLNCRPEAVSLRCGLHGKPELASPAPSMDLSFNTSHSRDKALFAVTCAAQVGVDIEWTGSTVAFDEIARRIFSRVEQRKLSSLPEVQRREAFFVCWTRKEAYVKARGDGLSHSFDRFEVSFLPGEAPLLKRTDGPPGESAGWTVAELHPYEGFLGALAVGTPCAKVHLWEWQPDAYCRGRSRPDLRRDAKSSAGTGRL